MIPPYIVYLVDPFDSDFIVNDENVVYDDFVVHVSSTLLLELW